MEFGPAVCVLVEPRVGWLEKEKPEGALVPLGSAKLPSHVATFRLRARVREVRTCRLGRVCRRNNAYRHLWTQGRSAQVRHLADRDARMLTHVGWQRIQGKACGFCGHALANSTGARRVLGLSQGLRAIRPVALHGVRGHRMPSLLRSTAPKILA